MLLTCVMLWICTECTCSMVQISPRAAARAEIECQYAPYLPRQVCNWKGCDLV
jgi:hypothetical protein